MIDLRSDTVTKPSKFMKQYMMDANLGDDVFQDDPTVHQLENKTAQLFGKRSWFILSSFWYHDQPNCLNGLPKTWR